MDRNDENISHDERRVSELINALPRLDAPSNFTAEVRTRIAQRRADGTRSRWAGMLVPRSEEHTSELQSH